MSETLKVLASAKTADQLKAQNTAARNVVINDVGVRVDDLDAKDYTKLTEWMQKTKKPAEWVVSFDSEWLGFFARVGTNKIAVSSVNISAERDIEKRRKILAALLKLKAATQAQVDAFIKANPDPEALAAVKKPIDDLTDRVKFTRKLIEEFKGLTFETMTPAFFGGLETWTTKHSWNHYVDFLLDIKADLDAQGIFDKYIKPGADYPVNLTEGTAKAIAAELKAGKKPNFTRARAEILPVVDGKIIAKYKAESIAILNKGVADDLKEIAKLTQQYTAMGGK
jgi:hypothetical protein